MADPANPATDIAVSRRVDFARLEAKWRDLETRANPSFFQSWTWMGSLAQERFPNPVLVEATRRGQTVALALFNRRGRTLYLGASGMPARDTIYVEFNGVLAETGDEAALTRACLRAARGGGPFARRLVLGGVDDVTATAAADIGHIHRDQSLPSPYVDISGQAGDFLARRGSNTRYQIRRSDRHYSAVGAIVSRRAETKAQAEAYLAGLTVLHQESWVSRGQKGAFANPFFARFHKALISTGLPRGEIDFLHVLAGERTIGYLYNFRYRGQVLAYQSGFDYGGAGPHGKPGLTCHHLAIELAIESGAARYDFLAGDGRYKTSLSGHAAILHWIEVDFRYSPRSVARGVRRMLTGLRDRFWPGKNSGGAR